MARILIIDDERPFCELCARILAAAGHEVRTAQDGFEGLNLFRAEPADIVLVDLQMPHGGLQVIRVLREGFPDVPIVAMSGFSRHRLEIAESLGANRYLSKPFTAQQLSGAVGEFAPTAAG